MEDFIVWYEKPSGDRYSREFTLDELIGHNHINEICDCPLSKDDKIIGRNRGVGLLDTEDKKIYADSSIVEFEYTYKTKTVKNKNGGFTHEYNSRLKCVNLKGSFEYNKDELRYEINIYDDNDFICLWYDIEKMLNIKIIDTIQDNELDLIKKDNI